MRIALAAVALCLCCWLTLVSPAIADATPPPNDAIAPAASPTPISAPEPSPSSEPVLEPAPDSELEPVPELELEPAPDAASKTYFFQVPAGSIKRQLTIDPPATKLVVTVESGNALVRCGVRGAHSSDNRLQTYTCTSGKPLIIERDPDQAIERFWAQDLSEVSDVQLRLDSYSEVPGEPSAAPADSPPAHGESPHRS